MASIIYYFSATGNSLEIARQIAMKLGDCTIKSMAGPVPDEPVGGSGQYIGFVFPVYFVGLPRLVKRFVEELIIRQGTYCFAVINHGGFEGNTLGMLDDILQTKGTSLSYGAGVRMPGNFIVKYQAPNPEKVQKIIKAAARKVDEIAAAIANNERLPVKSKAKLLSEFFNSNGLCKNIPKWDEKFSVTAKCTGCGLCAKVCPVNNIKIEDGHLVWLHHCERCVACIQWCPCEAILYGEKTIGHRRYHHPNVTVEDIIEGCGCSRDVNYFERD